MLLGRDLIHRFAKERFELFLTFWLAMYSGVGVLLPLGLYKWVVRSPWWLATVAVGVAGCVVNFPRFPGDSAIWIRRLRVGG